jgi:26S proteasome regulatory subunit T1
MPSATGQNWEKYNKEFADDEEPEKKITPCQMSTSPSITK